MTTLSANVIMHVSPTLSIHPFINTHKAAVIIKYKNTQSTMNRKIYKRNKIKKNSNKSLFITYSAAARESGDFMR